MNIQRILVNIGLSKKEVKVYLALLKIGNASIAEIARETRLKRTTLYPFIESLKLKGLIDLSIDKYNKKASVRDPRHLVRFAMNKERKYGRAVLKLEENLKELKKHYIQDLRDVELKYYEGRDECRTLLKELLKARREIIGYSSWMKYAFLGEKWCHKLEAQVKKAGLKERKIISGTEHNLYHGRDYVSHDDYKEQYFFRFIPPKREFIKVDIYLFNDIKIILSFKQVKPNGIYIRNKDLVQSDAAVFEVLYSEVGLEFEEYIKKHQIDKTKLKHKDFTEL